MTSRRVGRMASSAPVGQTLGHSVGQSDRASAPGFGGLLRWWRGQRRMSQLDLASEAMTTPRYVSFVETGRAPPSRQMVVRLAKALDVPLRERNGLLLAAGYAPLYARAQLDALAQGIKMLSPASIITVEGHTDAVGTEAYNLELSRVRAQAVLGYLVKHHGIDAARLKTVAYGESRPIEGSRPNDAVNRRVQFRGA